MVPAGPDPPQGDGQQKQLLKHHAAARLLHEAGWDGRRPLLGIAPINPFCWPVRPSLTRLLRSAVTGDYSHRYQAWYYFSTSDERERLFQRYLEQLARACTTFCAERGFQPLIVGMERLDEEACRRLNALMGGHVPLLLSKDLDGFAITEVLRRLSLLVTSRYHAQVLATGALVPAVAVSMDERLDNLAQDLGTHDCQLLHVLPPLLTTDSAECLQDFCSVDKRLSCARDKRDKRVCWLSSDRAPETDFGLLAFECRVFVWRVPGYKTALRRGRSLPSIAYSRIHTDFGVQDPARCVRIL